jgi:dihydrofolate reductase
MSRKTYELMEFWRQFLQHPSSEKSMNDFAGAIDNIPKIVFSHTLTNVDWKTASIANNDIKETVVALKKQPGKDSLVGSRSLIIQLIKLNLLDELQLCLYPVIAGNGSLLFENINDRIMFKLINTKTFKGGALIMYYALKNSNKNLNNC